MDLQILEDIYEAHHHEILGLGILILTVLLLRFGLPTRYSLKLSRMPAASPQTVSSCAVSSICG